MSCLLVGTCITASLQPLLVSFIYTVCRHALKFLCLCGVQRGVKDLPPCHTSIELTAIRLPAPACSPTCSTILPPPSDALPGVLSRRSSARKTAGGSRLVQQVTLAPGQVRLRMQQLHRATAALCVRLGETRCP